MVGWLTLRLSRVSFCDPQADSQGRRRQAMAAPSGELAVYRPGLERISDPVALEALLTTTGVITAERPHRLRNRTNSSHRGVNSRKPASTGKKKEVEGDARKVG